MSVIFFSRNGATDRVIAHLARYTPVTSAVFERTGVVWPVLLGGGAMLALASREALPVVLPLVVMVGLAVAVVLQLYRVEGQLPVFDVGVLTILITTIYSTVPLLGFWLAGLQWTTLTYLPLYFWNPDPAQVGAFSTRHIVYLYSLTAAYLVMRGRVPIKTRPLRGLGGTEIVALLVCGVGVLVYLAWLEAAYGYSYDPSYQGATLAANIEAGEKMPYILRQLSHNIFSIFLLLKFCALTWLMAQWRDWRWRTVMFLWIGAEGLGTIMRMGARTYFAMLVVASVLLYHRLVRPLPFARAATLSVALLGSLLVYGLARDLARDDQGGLTTLSKATSSPWVTMNEFQALYGIAYDLHARKEEGNVGPVPWELYAAEFSQFIPSQLLPFYKADSCMGYPVVEGVGVGCVLGVISQSVVGLDYLELIVRGLVLGVLFALIHRWYARRQHGYWTTVFYLCLCLWCYYTFRASTFYIAYYVLYRFVPLLVAVTLVQLVLRRFLRFAESCGV